MKILEILTRHRSSALILLVLGGLGNSFRFIGEWNNFWTVITSQAMFGWGFYCYTENRIIYLAPGGAIEIHHPKEVRFLVGTGALAVYLVMFAFNGYGRGWW